MPMIMVTAYQVKRRAFDHKSMYFHHPKQGLSTAENILRLLRSDKTFTEQEAHLLDIMMILQAEHGGGNNSTFATRVVSSTGTDTYAAISTGINSLKGPKHGAANHKVTNMVEDIKENVSNWEDESELKDYLAKIVRKETGDKSGLIYGMGHAVYTISDPRAIILKENAYNLAKGTEFEKEFNLISSIEKLSPDVLAEIKKHDRHICANVDMYTGFVYRMLGIPSDLTTPLFAVSRIPGWCAHRLEEVFTSKKIIRPAYKTITTNSVYIPLDKR
ncbi:MAG: citrate synthase, partial [Oscillospiraceae bacterium]